MIRERSIQALHRIIADLGQVAEGSEWYLFGSVDRDEPKAVDIDLLILCASDDQADAFRRGIDPDALPLPLDLSLMTFEEEKEIGAVRCQSARRIYPPCEQS